MSTHALCRDAFTVGLRGRCHAEALIGLVGSEEHGGDQARASEPYHLADRMDLRP